jgi:hypothetical protein
VSTFPVRQCGGSFCRGSLPLRLMPEAAIENW